MLYPDSLRNKGKRGKTEEIKQRVFFFSYPTFIIMTPESTGSKSLQKSSTTLRFILSVAHIESATSGGWYSGLIHSRTVKLLHAALEVARACKNRRECLFLFIYIFFCSGSMQRKANYSRDPTVIRTLPQTWFGPVQVSTRSGQYLYVPPQTHFRASPGGGGEQTPLQSFWNNLCCNFSFISEDKRENLLWLTASKTKRARITVFIVPTRGHTSVCRRSARDIRHARLTTITWTVRRALTLKGIPGGWMFCGASTSLF